MYASTEKVGLKQDLLLPLGPISPLPSVTWVQTGLLPSRGLSASSLWSSQPKGSQIGPDGEAELGEGGRGSRWHPLPCPLLPPLLSQGPKGELEPSGK